MYTIMNFNLLLYTQMPQSTITRNTKNEVVNELPVSIENNFSW
jgi:hypothetical protein